MARRSCRPLPHCLVWYCAVWLGLSACQVQPDIKPAQRADYLRTIALGLDQRARGVTDITGEALEESLCSERYASKRSAWRAPQRGEEEKQYQTPTCGCYLVRFALGAREFSHEVQALSPPGGGEVWGFPLVPGNAHAGGGPFYQSVSCSDGVCHALTRSLGGPIGRVLQQEFDLPGPLQPPFGHWLGLSLGWHWWSEHLIGDQYVLDAVEIADVDGRECYHVVQTFRTSTRVGRRQLWVAPDLGFAPVRCEALAIDPTQPLQGARTVHTWGDFQTISDGWWWPRKYTYDVYDYRPNADDTWSRTDRVRLQRLSADRQTETMPSPSIDFPVGTKLVLNPKTIPPSEQVPVEYLLAEKQASYRPWGVAERRVAAIVLPPDDPDFVAVNAAYLRPLDGTELADVAR